jgi:uncharacterized protein (UPF0276 family)
MSVLAGLPFLGVGLGYRPDLDRQIWANRTSIDWLELISEHYLARPREQLDQAMRLRGAFPLVPHGVELSIGTPGELDPAYLDALAELVALVGAPWYSDHLCFTRADGIALGQLTPLPRTRAVAADVARKAQQVQDRVGVPFLLENISYYIDIGIEGQLSEAEFLTEVMEGCECGLLLDLANVFVNASNHGFSALEFLAALPLERVVQVHLAGGEESPDALLDTHSAPVPHEVFALLRHLVERAPNLRAVLIERDSDFPDDFLELADDLACAREILGVRAG